MSLYGRRNFYNSDKPQQSFEKMQTELAISIDLKNGKIDSVNDFPKGYLKCNHYDNVLRFELNPCIKLNIEKINLKAYGLTKSSGPLFFIAYIQEKQNFICILDEDNDFKKEVIMFEQGYFIDKLHNGRFEIESVDESDIRLYVKIHCSFKFPIP